MAVITRAQVKTYLGIESTVSDDLIDRYLPIIDSKVKMITRRAWNDLIYGNIESGSDYIVVYTNNEYDDTMDYLLPGAQLTGTGIPTGAYITEIYPNGLSSSDTSQQIQISDDATETASGVYIYLNIPVAYLPTIAKGLWWLITQESKTMPSRSVSAKSIGTINVAFEDSKIDNKSGMPAWFVGALPRYHGGM